MKKEFYSPKWERAENPLRATESHDRLTKDMTQIGVLATFSLRAGCKLRGKKTVEKLIDTIKDFTQ